MADRVNELDTQSDNEQLDPEVLELSDRRDFLRSLGKWSTAAISAILLIESSPANEAAGWVSRRESRANGPGAWLNSRTNWMNRGGSRVNGAVR